MLRRNGRKHIRTFLIKREEYLSHIDDAEANGAVIHPVSLKSSIDRELLLNLVRYQHIPKVSHVKDVTDKAFEQWLQTKDDRGLADLSPEALEASIKASVHMNTYEPDPSCRIESLFFDYTTYLA